MTNKKIFYLIIPVIIYFTIIIFSDIQKIWNSISNLQLEYFLIFTGFWSLGVILRVIRWHIYMRKLDVRIPFKKNALYYLSGYSMLLSPGRVGEIIRSPYIKRDYGIPISKTGSLIFVERFYDFLSNISIISIAIIFTDISKIILVVPLGILTLMLFIIFNKKLFLNLSKKIKRIKRIEKIIPDLEESYQTIFSLLKPKFFLLSIFLTLGVVGFESIAAYFLLNSVNTSLNFATLTVIFNISSFIGAISFIPAGFGVVEGSLSGLLFLYGIPEHIGFSASILLRIIGTGLFSIIGFICLQLISKKRK